LFRHILPALVLLRKPLYGLAKRRKQPERYAKLFAPQLLTTLKAGCSMKDATKNLKWFGNGGIRAAAS
jgi:hypothetical protein